MNLYDFAWDNVDASESQAVWVEDACLEATVRRGPEDVVRKIRTTSDLNEALDKEIIVHTGEYLLADAIAFLNEPEIAVITQQNQVLQGEAAKKHIRDLALVRG